MARTPRYQAQHKRMRSWFDDFVLEGGNSGLLAFCQHARITLPTASDDVWPAFLGHYLAGRLVDEDRFAEDLASFPPIAARVSELRGAAGHA